MGYSGRLGAVDFGGDGCHISAHERFDRGLLLAVLLIYLKSRRTNW